MKLNFFFLLVLALVVGHLSQDYPDQYFEQKLDHFDDSTTTTWQQRYWVNADYFDPTSGPVFLYIGGEGAENSNVVQGGAWINFAYQYNALCVCLEHRFYGNSKPTADASTENLVYLTSKQALADLASFRDFIHSSYGLSDSNRWIAFGGSYPGALAAWFRLKYPDSVYAAVSSSAPINAIVDFADYNKIVGDSLKAYSSVCTDEISAATSKMQSYAQSGPSGYSTLQNIFKLCEPISNQNDLATFYDSIIGHFDQDVQYNEEEGSDVEISTVCKIMTNTNNGDAIHRYAAVNSYYMKLNGESCIGTSYNNLNYYYEQTDWSADWVSSGTRQWFFQTCNEFGYFQSTSSNQQPFGVNTVPANYLVNQCSDVFGSNYSPDQVAQNVAATNAYYGGYNYQGTRVVFVNGGVDPWHGLSFNDPNNPPNTGNHVIFIEGTAHCADMGDASSDPPELAARLSAARDQISSIIGTWLNE